MLQRTEPENKTRTDNNIRTGSNEAIHVRGSGSLILRYIVRKFVMHTMVNENNIVHNLDIRNILFKRKLKVNYKGLTKLIKLINFLYP